MSADAIVLPESLVDDDLGLSDRRILPLVLADRDLHRVPVIGQDQGIEVDAHNELYIQVSLWGASLWRLDQRRKHKPCNGYERN